MGDMIITTGVVREIEKTNSSYNKVKNEKTLKEQPYDGLRLRVELLGRDLVGKDSWKELPWAIPLLPKTFQSIPKEGELAFIIYDGTPTGQRYYIGPIISQPQFNTYCGYKDGDSLLQTSTHRPLEKISNNDDTTGAFPRSNDVAVVGRGAEDVILRHKANANKNNLVESEIQLRAGIRKEPTSDDNKNLVGNIIFNGTDPAYIQMKYKNGLIGGRDKEANSVINLVANRINIMSNKDNEINDKIGDKDTMIKNKDIGDIMDKLHQVPKGDELVKLLKIIKGCIMHHVHPWAGMEQCGDWGGYIEQLDGYDIDSILSKYVRIS